MKEKNTGKKSRLILAAAEHLLAAALAFVLVFLSAGKSVILTGPHGDVSYDLYESDRNRSYKDSVLLNNIFGNNMAEAVRLCAWSTLFETNGQYDGEKLIDVTAYVNRGSTLPGEYITASYTVSNLLKWAQNGFAFEERQMTAVQSRQFLSDFSTRTRIVNNSAAGGMNSFLNTQIAGNTETGRDAVQRAEGEDYVFFNDPAEDEEPETRRILINRYRTADGHNIEDLVSDWGEYRTLCANVEEAANSLYESYSEYLSLKQYYAENNTSFRFYLQRNIGGNKEIYTNVQALGTTADAAGLKGYFGGLDRFLYYCPYDMAYETDLILDEPTIRSMFREYSYIYPDQIRVYAGIDLNTPAMDDFSGAARKFADYVPAASALQFAAILLAVMLCLLLFIRLVRAVPAVSEKRIPTELLVLLWLVFSGNLIIFTVFLIIGRIDELPAGNTILTAVLAAVSAFLADLAFSAGAVGIARKSRAGVLWQDSLIRRAVQGLGRMAVYTASHTGLVVWTLLPYTLFVLLNAIVTAVLFGLRNDARFSVLLLVLAADIVIGILFCRARIDRHAIIEQIERINAGEDAGEIDTGKLHGENRRLAEAVNDIGEGIREAVNRSMQDERMKTDLITNVSHDIKTPLTSIINYTDLLKREQIDNERAAEYIRILEEKAGQLKHLTEDLVEASKISSGNIEVNPVRLDLQEFLNQMLGEFGGMLEERGLTPILRAPEEAVPCMADPHHLWRVAENLFTNVSKYALENTRVYIDLWEEEDGTGAVCACFSIRNISGTELHVSPEELTERFIRGDETRGGEGSGLGLSIAESLVRAQGGTLHIDIDGDLFKVTVALEGAE
ncbi:MAG: HAMP domain-containing histidine kinase [Lachnospiraceae bacterium]|nr:HAMP domain-containing histidine kinase [Lachnospiraceae bacterium]